MNPRKLEHAYRTISDLVLRFRIVCLKGMRIRMFQVLFVASTLPTSTSVTACPDTSRWVSGRLRDSSDKKSLSGFRSQPFKRFSAPIVVNRKVENAFLLFPTQGREPRKTSKVLCDGPLVHLFTTLRKALSVDRRSAIPRHDG